MKTFTCTDCAWWQKVERESTDTFLGGSPKPVHGECRRALPVFEGRWPYTKPDDWCYYHPRACEKGE